MIRILYRQDRTRNMRRYYRLDIQPDLFGRWAVIKEWGRIGYAGQIKKAAYCDLNQAVAALQKYSQIKERRGYVIYHEITEPKVAHDG